MSAITLFFIGCLIGQGDSFFSQTIIKGTSGSRSTLSMMKTTNVNGLMSFGSEIPMKVLLPTRDPDQAKKFISNLDTIVEATYEVGKYEKIGDGRYLLKFNTLPLPGLDKITPEIEVGFNYSPEEGTVRMTSGNWTLKGTTGVLKDSRFMQTFAISLEGLLKIVPNTATNTVMAEGYVKYVVQGEKPSLFKAAPDILLDSTIDFIKTNINDFASKDFQVKFSKAFKSYALDDLKAKAALAKSKSAPVV
jgi:hypothetical protein